MSNDIKKQFEEALNKVISDINQVTRQMYLLREYLDVTQSKSKLFRKYSSYFEEVFTGYGNFVILSLCKLFDKGKDCITIYTLRKSIENSWDRIFDGIVTNKDTLLAAIKTRLKPVNQIIQDIENVRNKRGLAHGIPHDHSIPPIDTAQMEKLLKTSQEIVNLIYKEYYGNEYDFNPMIYSRYTLNNLIEDYDQQAFS